MLQTKNSTYFLAFLAYCVITYIIRKNSMLFLIFLPFLTLTYQQNLTLPLSQFGCLLSYQQTTSGSLLFNCCQEIDLKSSGFYFRTWSQCSDICCGLSIQIYPQFNQWSISQCQQNNINLLKTSWMITIVIIVLSVVLGVISIVAVAYKIYRVCSNQKIFHQGQIKPNQTIDTNDPKWLQDTQQVAQGTLSNMGNEDSHQCPICLEQNINLTTPCSHRFHIHCLLAWLTKNRNCPLCKRTNLDELKLKCKNCQKKYLLIYMPRAIMNINRWTEFDNSCGTCILRKLKARVVSTQDLSLVHFNASFIFDEI